MRLELAVNKTHDRLRNGKTQTLVASARGNNIGVDSHQVAIPVDQRTTAVPGIDGGIGLHIDHGPVHLGLPAYRADDSFGDRMIQAFRGADGNHRLP